MPETLHSQDRGWHPKIGAVLHRLEAIGVRRRDADYRALLLRDTQGRIAGDSLHGDLKRALEVLRRVEADELHDLFNLDPPRPRSARAS